MKLPALLVSDTHFTAAPADNYRWGLFPWLREQCQLHHIRTLVHLGDLTDAKDYHSAHLVNQVVCEMHLLAHEVEEMFVLMGNHDYLKGGYPPYFAFLSTIQNINMIWKPMEAGLAGPPAFFLPHTRNPVKDWAGMDLSHYNYVFMHQTIKGAVASNGEEMEGEQLPDMGGWGKIYSGDIHVPQKIGLVEYVGSPYHVHFGDSFKPRCLVIDRNQRVKEISFPSIERRSLKVGSIRELRRVELPEGSQVKITLRVPEAEKHDWSRMRRQALDWADRVKVECHGVKLEVQKSRERILLGSKQKSSASPEEALLRHAKREELTGEVVDAGLECME